MNYTDFGSVVRNLISYTQKTSYDENGFFELVEAISEMVEE